MFLVHGLLRICCLRKAFCTSSTQPPIPAQAFRHHCPVSMSLRFTRRKVFCSMILIPQARKQCTALLAATFTFATVGVPTVVRVALTGIVVTTISLATTQRAEAFDLLSWLRNALASLLSWLRWAVPTARDMAMNLRNWILNSIGGRCDANYNSRYRRWEIQSQTPVPGGYVNSYTEIDDNKSFSFQCWASK